MVVGKDGMDGSVGRGVDGTDGVIVGVAEALLVDVGDGEDGVEVGNGLVKGTETC